MKRVICGVLCGLSSVACGGGGGLGQPAAQFPTRSALDSVASRNVSAKAQTSIVDAARWDMQPPMPAAAAYPQQTAWDQLFVEAVTMRAGAVRASSELRCAAAEVARFYVEHGGAPDDGIRDHILVRCGSTLVSTSISWQTLDVPDNIAEGELARQERAPLLEYLQKNVLSNPGEAGLGFARGGGHAVWVGYSGRPRARFDGFSPLINGDSVTVQGALLAPAAHLIAITNQGAYGTALCQNDPGVALPAFRLTCPVLAQDAHTRIELATRTEEQVLLSVAARLEVRREETADLSYDAGAYGDNQPAATAEAFGTGLLAGLNRARASAGAGQLGLEVQQSRTNGKLAPHMLLSSLSADSADENTIALGLLAGWDVQSGMIRDGGIYFGVVNGSRNPSRWLTYALESPLGRWVLLSPDMARAGVGVSALEPNGVTALITTYSFFKSDDHSADEVALLTELARQRQARGLPPPQRVPSDGALQRALQRIRTSQQTSVDGLTAAAQEVVNTSHQSISGNVMETTDLNLVNFDPSLLTAPTLRIEVGVTHYRAPGGAWGQYVVLLLVHGQSGAVREAKHTEPSRPRL